MEKEERIALIEDIKGRLIAIEHLRHPLTIAGEIQKICNDLDLLKIENSTKVAY